MDGLSAPTSSQGCSLLLVGLWQARWELAPSFDGRSLPDSGASNDDGGQV